MQLRNLYIIGWDNILLIDSSAVPTISTVVLQYLLSWR